MATQWSAGAVTSDYYYYQCNTNGNYGIESTEATETVILRYAGNSDFRVDKIAWQDFFTTAVTSFCVPQNHYYWASETGITHCTDSDTLNIYNPSTFYIAYSTTDAVSTNGNYNDVQGIVSPAKVSEFTITASVLSADSDNDESTTFAVRIHWDLEVYKCIITLSTSSTTYSCDEASLSLETANCSESAFAMELTQRNTDAVRVTSISITDEDGNTFAISNTICFAESSIAVDFSTVWSNDDLSVYHVEGDALCLHETGNIIHSVLH